MHRRGAAEQFLQQRRASLLQPLSHIKRLQRRLRKARPLAIQPRHPPVQGRQHRHPAAPQLNSRMLPHHILRMLQQTQQLRYPRALNARKLPHHRLALVHHPPNPTVLVVPVRIPHGVLGVANDDAAKVRYIEGPVEPKRQIRRAKGSVRRRNHIQAVRSPHHALIKIKFRQGNRIAPQQRRRGHPLLVFIRKVRTRNARRRRSLPIADRLGISEGMVDAQRRPCQGQRV